VFEETIEGKPFHEKLLSGFYIMGKDYLCFSIEAAVSLSPHLLPPNSACMGGVRMREKM
jgi:hypothetical protein